MKTFLICSVCGSFAFVALGYQIGMFSEAAVDDEAEAAKAQAAQKKKPAPPAVFPEDLAPACKGKAIPQAAHFDAQSGKPHRLVFLYESGLLHEKWQELVKEEWQADTVSNTELIVVVGKDKETFLSIQTYPNGAPPVRRFKYELDVRVVAAKTGQVVGRNRFAATPRPVRRLEDWGLTKIGQPVSFTTVYNWVTSAALTGFPVPDRSKLFDATAVSR